MKQIFKLCQEVLRCLNIDVCLFIFLALSCLHDVTYIYAATSNMHFISICSGKGTHDFHIHMPALSEFILLEPMLAITHAGAMSNIDFAAFKDKYRQTERTS